MDASPVNLPIQPENAPCRIGVLRMSAMGDCLMLLSTLQRIKRLRPNWQITWFISEVWMPLFKEVQGIDFVPMVKPKGIADYIKFARRWRKEPFDVFLCMQASLRANLLYLGVKAPLKLGFDAKRARDGHGLFINRSIPSQDEHIFEGFERFADSLGVPRQAPQWHLPLKPSDVLVAQERLKSWRLSLNLGAQVAVITVNLAASKEERTPIESFYIRLFQLILAQFNVLILMVGGPSDWEISFAQRVFAGLAHKGVKSRVANWVGQTTLPQLAAAISVSKLMIAPDSGPAHLANALGVPVVGLFAVAPPGLSAAYHWQSYAVNVYPEAVRSILKQDPATVQWGKRVHDRNAMALISPEAVIEKVEVIEW